MQDDLNTRLCEAVDAAGVASFVGFSVRFGGVPQFEDMLVVMKFRLNDADAYAAAYGEAHQAPDWLPRFVYGLPERMAFMSSAAPYWPMLPSVISEIRR